jgi:hypothetical protein
MSEDKIKVLRLIKDAFNKEINIPNNLRLPRDIEFVISGNNVEMLILKDGVLCNMQDDNAAFEGWALVLKRWGKFDKVVLSWDRPQFQTDSSEEAHYQRFLFRMKHFLVDFKKWFSVSPSCLSLLIDLKIDDITDYYLSFPKKDRDNNALKGTESQLEYKFSFGEWKDALKSASNADYLNRQLLVGVFYKPVKNKTRILPQNKSAIDIWGISKNNELLLFELKIDGYKPLGIITELYFYCCVMRRFQKGQFKYEKNDVPNIDRIAKTINIKAYFLAPELHPLIDKNLIDYLNERIAPDVEFHYLKFPSQGGNPIRLKF